MCAQYQNHIAKINESYAAVPYDKLAEMLLYTDDEHSAKDILSIMTERERTLSSDFMDSLSENERVFVKERTRNPITDIPKGSYCYTLPKIKDGELKLKRANCPHMSRSSESGFSCEFMGLSDKDMGGGLLWDGVKECGIKLISKEDIPTIRDMSQ